MNDLCPFCGEPLSADTSDINHYSWTCDDCEVRFIECGTCEGLSYIEVGDDAANLDLIDCPDCGGFGLVEVAE